MVNQVIGAALEVHSILGPGYLESVYEEALAKELELRNIPFERQKVVAVSYKGFLIGEGRLDILIDNQLVVELKAVECFLPIHTAQVLSYLKATDLRVGLLLNFKASSLRYGIKRVIRSH